MVHENVAIITDMLHIINEFKVCIIVIFEEK